MIVLILALSISLPLHIVQYYFYRKKGKLELSPFHEAALEALTAFERDRHVLLDVQQINPENVYLRNPGRG